MTPPVGPYPFTVKLTDGSTERLTIKTLPITKLFEWIYLARDQKEPAMVALCTGKDMDWIDALDIDSFAQLAKKCNELNFFQALRLAKGAPVAAALVAPLMRQNALGLRVAEILSDGSGDLSTTPPLTASALGTESALPKSTASTDSSKQSLAAAA